MFDTFALDESAKLFYVVGAKQSGKDSIVDRLKHKLDNSSHVLVAHRYVTRSLDKPCEHSIELSMQEFSHRQAQGDFAMVWQHNGCHYAVGEEVKAWLGMGLSVVFCGAIDYIEQAREIFGERLHVIAIDVDQNVLQHRLNLSSNTSMLARLRRNKTQLQALPEDCWILDNNRSLDTTVDQLYQHIEQELR